MNSIDMQGLKDKIVMTGQQGFIGKNLSKKIPNARLLNREKEQLENIDSLKEFLKEARVIFHFAGVNAGSGYAPSNESMTINNVLATRNLIEGIRRYCSHPPVFVLLSSIHVYSAEGPTFTEDSKIGPPTYYGLTKLGQELIVQQAATSGILNPCILRASNIYGPGCRPNYNSVIATFIDKIAKGEALKLYGNGESQLDLIYIDDIINVLLRVNDLISAGQSIFNLSYGKSLAIRNVAEILSEVLNKKLNMELVDTPKVAFHIENSRLLATLGSYEFTGIKDGLKRTISDIPPAAPSN